MIESFYRYGVLVEFNSALEQDSEFGYLYSLFVKLRSEDEFAYEQFLDTKEALIATLDELLYAGSRLDDGWCEIYFYAQDTKGLDKQVATFLRGEYAYESSSTKDAKWDFWYKNLLPNELEFLYMEAKKIVDDLLSEGDELESVREVEHYATFDTPTQMERFVANASKVGFRLKDELDIDGYGVAVVREHSLLDLNSYIETLYELAKKEHGNYELFSTVLSDEK